MGIFLFTVVLQWRKATWFFCHKLCKIITKEGLVNRINALNTQSNSWLHSLSLLSFYTRMLSISGAAAYDTKYQLHSVQCSMISWYHRPPSFDCQHGCCCRQHSVWDVNICLRMNWNRDECIVCVCEYMFTAACLTDCGELWIGGIRS